MTASKTSAERSTNFVEFGSGTIRTSKKSPFFLVPIELLEAVADTRLHGDRKYQPANWMRGDKEFFVDCLSHAIKHLIDAPWDSDEDFDTHLGHAACNIAFILWAKRRGKISREDYQNAARILGAGEPVHIKIDGSISADEVGRLAAHIDYMGLRESL
jgi:hypothetical protein